ncbi:sugar transferase [Saccharothrix sp. AJ9571]|nr:sugar transferase [Saccharothrix sp. AJ9571]
MTRLSPVRPPLLTAGPRLPRPRGKQRELSWWQLATERVNAVALLLAVVDVAAVVVAAGVVTPPPRWGLLTAVLLLGIRACGGLYRKRLWLSWLHDVPRSAGTTAVALGLVTVLALGTGRDDGGPVAAQWMVLLFAVLSEPARLCVLAVGRWGRRRFGRGDRSIVVGGGKVGAELVRTMQAHPEFGLKPIGIVDDDPAIDRALLPVGLIEGDLPEVITRLRVGTVVIAFSHAQDPPIVDVAIAAHQQGCTTLVVPRMFELYQDGRDVERLRTFPLMRLGTAPTVRPSWWIKRLVDIVLATAALVALAPVIVCCAVLVLLESGRPAFFRQTRVGLGGRTFVLFKLRTVRPGGEDDSQTRWSVAGDSRVGPVGGFLRRTSLDELPQLWNILRGDMSIVGPRPERPGFVREFSAIHDLYWARHRVPAGLTGFAQAQGLRGDTSIADRARYDNYYIANWSLWLDLKIVLLTVGELLRRRKN